MANKTKVINPNNFINNGGPNSFVSPEDLTIYVELTTSRKGRTILTSSGTQNSTPAVSVRFIDGEDINGKKTLTTKFTELTTNLGEPQTSENLGITNIDIDFNSSFAPLITINFVDVRGSAIFQNEARTANNENKYSVFFQLPYPLYKLKIKGYYGKPVEYCLHMTKFTSRFNSQTGNFEITASYVGYTYAMLSDMLIGFLKAISYTNLGKEKYAELKQEDSTLVTVHELYILISRINDGVTKLLSTSDDYADLKNLENRLTDIETIRANIQDISKTIDLNKSKSDYSFTISSNTNIEPYLDAYRKKITPLIQKFNDDSAGLTSLDINIFTNPIVYSDITKVILNDTTTTTPDSTTKKAILDYINTNNYTLANEAVFTAIDLRNLIKALDDAKTNINSSIVSLKEQLGNALAVKIKTETNFDPSIRNTIKIFTAAAEVFMYCIHNVSSAAITNPARTQELKKAFTTKENSDLPNDTTFYPWPDYREGDDIKGYTEAYLGKSPLIDNPTSINELIFINDLFKAFITQAEEQAKEDLLSEAEKTNWIPSNPMDTRVFSDEYEKIDLSPYQRVDAYTTLDDLLTLVLIRAFTFLGITNNQNTLSIEDEVKKMADCEAQAILKYVKEKTIVQSLSTYDLAKITEVASKVTFSGRTAETKVIQKDGDDYKYNYILNNKPNKYFPLNKGFINGNWNVVKQNELDNFLFLGNRGFKTDNISAQDLLNISNNILPADDGAVYIKFIDRGTYDSITVGKSLENSLDGAIKKLSLTELLKESITNYESVGFNSFAGPFGIQEFSELDWNTSETSDLNALNLPLRYLFYTNIDTGLSLGNGLGKNRKQIDSKNQTINQKYLITLDNIPEQQSSGADLKRLVENYEDYGKTRELLITTDSNLINYPYINFVIDEQLFGGVIRRPISLFGSRFYYGQKTDEAKAFLFLHTLPFTGLFKGDGLLSQYEILNLFKYRAGFISVPKLWAAFVGGLLWRYTNTNDPITFIEGNESLLPTYGNIIDLNRYPAKNQYLTYKINEFLTTTDTYSMSFTSYDTGVNYIDIETVILYLPKQTKDEFINIFKNFVSQDWSTIKNKLELKPTNTWVQTYNQIILLNGGTLTKDTNDEYFLDSNSMKSYYGSNFDNYIIFNPLSITQNIPEAPLSDPFGGDNTPVTEQTKEYKYNYFLEINPNSSVKNDLIKLLREELIFANASYKIWGADNLISTNPNYSDVIIKKEIFEEYFKQFFANFKGITFKSEEEEIKTKLFGTNDENVIKFMLYRTCKNIYDKWVANSDDANNVFFQCGGRGLADSKLALKRTNDVSSTPRLIDSFKFVNRSFTDIGDEFAINPFPIHDIMKDNPNVSLYDMITSVLSSNNFDFVPLPSFINYRDESDVKSVFTPYPKFYEEPTVGPSFVCVYVGQKSKHLDFGINNNVYTNDGFDVYENNLNNAPNDFTGELQSYDEPAVFFEVNFGQQNQNIFKDVELDQNEFSETAESLQIMDDISTKGAETNRTFAGQNIYNVYAIRSYKAEIEMMGDAMIQPMMYFQLNNIPMFHGAYMITRVKHSIKPNYMSTNFTGVRIRKPITPIFTAGELFSSIVDTINIASAGSSGGAIASRAATATKNLEPIVLTLFDRGGANGYADSLGLAEIRTPAGISNFVKNNKLRNQLISEAIEPLEKMLTDWVFWMKQEGFKGKDGQGKTYATIVSAFRDYELQESMYKSNPDITLPGGSSNHGWGIAIDITTYTKDGKEIELFPNGKPNNEEGFDYSQDKNYSLKWLAENSYRYGFLIPSNLRDFGRLDEFWHFEYHGTSAICLLEKNPVYRGPIKNSNVGSLTININKPYEPFVQNPIDKDGNRAVYTDCKYKKSTNYDGVVNITSKAYPDVEPEPSQLQMADSLTGTWQERAKTMIKKFEGFTEVPKPDTDGKLRGGYGTNIIITSPGAQPQNITSTTVFTEETANLTLDYDINNRFKNLAIGQLGQANWDKLNDNQKAAIICYSYNTGPDALKTRGIVASITANNYTKAAEQIFLGPITAEGVVKLGLIKRRKIESKVFAKPV